VSRPIGPAPPSTRERPPPPSVVQAGGRGPGTAERTAPTERRHVEPAKERGRTRQTKQRQAKPRQAKRRQNLEQQTVQELRKQAREAGIKGRSSMTKDQLIKAQQPGLVSRLAMPDGDDRP
jgi:Rho termination factor, N-terminal domain